MQPPSPILALAALCSGMAVAQQTLSFKTSGGPLAVTPVGHGSLLLEYGGRVIHVYPYSEVTDYAAQPDADRVRITHDHPNHYDQAALGAVSTATTRYVMSPTSAETFRRGERVSVMCTGDERTIGGITLQAVPAYNLVRGPEPGSRFHPEGRYDGYLATFGDFTVYVAGDTECIPAMSDLGGVDLAFVPINLPYTMPPEEAVGCIKFISPGVVVPYRQVESDPRVVADALEGSGIKVRVLNLP
jgi:L-ascorbate metabolism protein UlaG (beta-lactamase superfamily)